MKLEEYFYNIIPIIIVSLLFKQYVAPYIVDDESYLVKKFLYNENYSSTKPYLWVYIPLDINSRRWNTFNERNSLNISQPYIEYCIKSIISKNKEVFNVCVITDNDLKDIIPNWTFDMNELSDPIKERVRRLAQVELINYYGGIVVPPSFLCLKNLRKLYGQTEYESYYVECGTNDIILGGKRNNKDLKNYISTLNIYIADMSNEPEFKNLLNVALEKNITKIDPRGFGLRTVDNIPVTTGDLLSDKSLNLSDDMFGIYIPREKLLTDKQSEWFTVISVDEIKKSNLYIARYFD